MMFTQKLLFAMYLHRINVVCGLVDHEAIQGSLQDQTSSPSTTIAFMGGSLTRYQYISLAYYRTHGTWIDPSSHPSLVMEKDHASWIDFYHTTNAAFGGYELCDCYRLLLNHSTLTENRYYLSPKYNLYYIQAFGNIHSHGHWDPRGLPPTQPNITSPMPFKWEMDWASTILNYISLLRPKPQWLVLNAGHWKNSFHLLEYRTRVFKEIKNAGIKSIWKTTTYTQNHTLNPTQIRTDHHMCAMTTLCLNLSWTRSLNKTFYWDGVHFKEPVYQRMNRQLLEMLGQ